MAGRKQEPWQEPSQRMEQLEEQIGEMASVTKVPEGELEGMVLGGKHRILAYFGTDPGIEERFDTDRFVLHTVETLDEMRRAFAKTRAWDGVFMRDTPDVHEKCIDLAIEMDNRDPDIHKIVSVAPSVKEYEHAQEFTELQRLKEEMLLHPITETKGLWRMNVRGKGLFTRKSGIGIHVGNPDSLPTSLEQVTEALAPDDTSRYHPFMNTLTEDLSFFYPTFSLERRRPVGLKDGGSCFDLVKKGDKDIILHTARMIGTFAEEHPELAMIVMVGGGPTMDIIKEWILYDDSIIPRNRADGRMIEKLALQGYDTQAQLLYAAFEDTMPGVARQIEPDRPSEDYTDDMFKETPVIIYPYASLPYRRKFEVSAAQSDAQFVLAAWMSGCTEGLFIKDALAIHPSDPNLVGYGPDNPPLRSVSYRERIRKETTERGEKYELSFIGEDGKPDHLLEEDAAELAIALDHPLRIAVGHPRKTDRLLEKAFLEGGGDLSYFYLER